MSSRPIHETEDMQIHRDYLTDISEKIEAGYLQTNRESPSNNGVKLLKTCMMHMLS